MRGLVVTAALLLLAPGARADVAVTKSEGLAIIGTPALPPGFKNFPWVNPDAPKGGEVALAAVGTFDNFNPFILRGTPGPVGSVFETLTTLNVDEPFSAYGHLAETIEVPTDRGWVAFNLRPEAHFNDGTPVTAEDVAWTFNTLRDQGRPLYRQYYAGVDHVEVDGARRVVFRFKPGDNRELPLILGELPVLPEHWWKGRDFAAPLTEPPLGSGPYRVGAFTFGRTLTMERVPDYWGRDTPTSKGLNNFDRIRTEYYRDPTVTLEAFKAGQADWRSELGSKVWATGYDFPAVHQGLVVKAVLPTHLPTGMQGYIMNTRRPMFADRRVREGLAQVFDFEWTNKNLLYGLNIRTNSYFSGSDFASSGLPGGDELALLQPFRDRLPPELFTKPFVLPATDGSGNNREGLRRALALLQQGGWTLHDRRMVDAQGQQMRFEILLDQPAFEGITLPYADQLRRLGIDVSVRTVDPAQYQHRVDNFDFDMTVEVFGETDSPGNEQLDFWGCAARDTVGSSNSIGVCDPAIEALTRKIVSAPDRPQLVAATRALDRVLLWNWYLVPQWRRNTVWIAYWDRFGQPGKPVRTGVDFNSWWIDPARAAKIDAVRAHHN